MRRFSTSKRIVCVGDICADVVIPYGQIKASVSRIAGGESCEIPPVVFQGGGSIANTASVLGKLGMLPLFVGKVGRDKWGEFLKGDLAADGVDVGYMTYQEEGIITVLAVLDENGERTLIPWLPPGAQIPQFSPGDFPDDLLARAGWVHTSGLALKNDGPGARSVVEFMEKCRRAGVILSFDLNLRAETFGFSPGRQEIFRRAVELSDVVMGSGMDELHPLTGCGTLEEAAVKLAKEGRIAIVRDGKNPVLLADKEQLIRIPVYGEELRVVSTIGAGDSFSGGFIAGAAKGLSLIRAVQWGNVCAAYRITGTKHRAVPSPIGLRQMADSYYKLHGPYSES